MTSMSRSSLPWDDVKKLSWCWAIDLLPCLPRYPYRRQFPWVLISRVDVLVGSVPIQAKKFYFLAYHALQFLLLAFFSNCTDFFRYLRMLVSAKKFIFNYMSVSPKEYRHACGYPNNIQSSQYICIATHGDLLVQVHCPDGQNQKFRIVLTGARDMPDLNSKGFKLLTYWVLVN